MSNAPPVSASADNNNDASCPVDHKAMAIAASQRPSPSAPVRIKPQNAGAASGPPVCDSAAMNSSSGGAAPAASVNDVFPDSEPLPGQRYPLSTTAVRSIIPRGGVADDPNAVWEFPSNQRFFNAMTKKGWSPSEPEIPSIVSIHNTVNERCWREILAYESFHAAECGTPKLLKFKGAPRTYSPKARFWNMFGYVLPFDRHDWTVDRCGVKVRYVIDFYEGKKPDSFALLPRPQPQPQNTTATVAPAPAAAPAQTGGLQLAPPPAAGTPAGLGPTVYLDVRPAVSFGGIIDRVRMEFKRRFGTPPTAAAAN